MEKITSLFHSRKILVLLIALYAVAAIESASNIISHSTASTAAIEKIFGLYSLQNEGAQALEKFDKEHPVLGMFFSSPVKDAFKLSSPEESDSALHSEVKHHLKTVRLESSVAAWWAWFLLNVSLLYVVIMISFERSFTDRYALFALTSVTVVFFVIGIFAPAMVIWTSPVIPMQSGNLEFVVQHQVRGIAAIIEELFKSDHWIIGGFLFLFSIVTPLTKACLTFFVTATHNKQRNFRIGQFLHIIGKWSMADVFVAGVLLALYALKFQEATKSIPCIGLYFFTGYCLLSMTTTELLTNSELTNPGEPRACWRLDNRVIAGLFVLFFAFVGLSTLYTYQQYTLNTLQPLKTTDTPHKLDNSDLVLPVHK